MVSHTVAGYLKPKFTGELKNRITHQVVLGGELKRQLASMF